MMETAEPAQKSAPKSAKEFSATMEERFKRLQNDQERDQMLDEMKNYQRQKDPEVQKMLDEINGRHDISKEHKGKWMAKGDSPTKRLICKFFALFILVL